MVIVYSSSHHFTPLKWDSVGVNANADNNHNNNERKNVLMLS